MLFSLIHCGCIDLDIEANALIEAIAYISALAHSSKKFAVLFNVLEFTLGQLPLGGYKTWSQQWTALLQLVETVHAELDLEDAVLLSDSAL